MGQGIAGAGVDVVSSDGIGRRGRPRMRPHGAQSEPSHGAVSRVEVPVAFQKGARPETVESSLSRPTVTTKRVATVKAATIVTAPTRRRIGTARSCRQESATTDTTRMLKVAR